MSEFTENYGLEKPAQNEFYNIDVQNQNMDKIDQAIAEAGNNPQLEIDVAEIKNKIGSTTDTGGTQTAGSVLAKENAILGEVGKIGAPNDAGSSSTTGTTVSIFAKLNYLVDQVKSYLFNIYNRLGTPTDSANGTTSGNVHAKLNWFLNLFGKTDDSGATATTGTAMGKLNKILSKSFETPTDTEFIKMCLNSTQALTFDYLNPTETELLNVNGKGYVGHINVFGNTTAGTGNTTIIKVYIDNELFFHFGISGSTTRKDIWFDGGIYPDTAWSGAIFNLKQYINGNLEGMRAGLSKLLKFETSLRVLASSTSSDNNNRVTITYGLEE